MMEWSAGRVWQSVGGNVVVGRAGVMMRRGLRERQCKPVMSSSNISRVIHSINGTHPFPFCQRDRIALLHQAWTAKVDVL